MLEFQICKLVQPFYVVLRDTESLIYPLVSEFTLPVYKVAVFWRHYTVPTSLLFLETFIAEQRTSASE